MFAAQIYRSAEQINSAMARVYAHMALAVITSMVVSFLVSTSPALMTFLFTGVMKWIVMKCAVIIVIAIACMKFLCRLASYHKNFT
jgi:FtsH-binding integral membrane protein